MSKTNVLNRDSDPVLTSSSEQWRQCLFEQSDDMLLFCNGDGRILEANRQAAQHLGLDAAALPATSIHLFDYLTPPTARKLAPVLKNPPGRAQTFSAVSLLCEGKISFLADILASNAGDGVSLITIRDASRRWRLESHVQRLVTAVDSTPEIIFLTNNDLRITFVNAAFQTVTGYTIEEALGRTADFLRAPSEAPRVREYLEAVAQGKDWQGELMNARSDGTLYPIETTISPIFDKDGQPLGYVAFERDMTIRKQLESDLRAQKDYALSIINSLEVALYSLDRGFHLHHMNDGWKKFPARHGGLDLSNPLRAGNCLLDYVPDTARREELRVMFQEVLEDGKPREFQCSDERHHWLVRVTPWHQEGAVCGLIYGVHDQTQYHELQRQLFQAQKMETIGALAAGVAHDFNNLLQVIRGNVSLLLLDEQLSREERHGLEQIEEAGTRAAGITHQLLSFSRASDEQAAVLDFNDVIQEASLLSQRSLMTKIELRLRPATEPVRVKMDNTRAQQLLLNLMVNAQDAMPQGGALTVTNALVPLTFNQAQKAGVAPGTEFVRCTVADTGSGIPPEILGRIFDPFFTTKGQGKGTGLGLAIVQTIVSQAHGLVEVESRAGEGTAFHLYLPIAQADGTTRARRPRIGLRKGTGRIMVVDDLDMVLEFTCNFLRAAGYTVCSATSAETALELIERLPEPVDLVFTDYNMSGMNGRELIQHLRQRRLNLKFILTSGYLESSERDELEQAANLRILDKPFSMRDATDLISEMLGCDAADGEREQIV